MKKQILISSIYTLIAIITGMGYFITNKNYFTKPPYDLTQSFLGIDTLIVHDTLNYVKDSLINHKERYQHKQLGEMLKDLKLPVKSYAVLLKFVSEKTMPGIILYFDNHKEHLSKLGGRKKQPVLQVYFETGVQTDKVMELFWKDKADWLDDERKFYGSQIVKDIK